MQEYLFTLALTHDQCMHYYQGTVQFVQVMSDNGKRIRFPAARLRPFISSIGIRGRFRLILSENNQFQSLEKIL
ncbi:DUF2835 domain-containing protein [Pseudoalteromonas xiamenensis]|uniref:DUF2835 domain-containing protein n=1 Tax=Pseudoalteromonas xiamenensis TaxID=882626 RepID=UPI0027E4E9CF|nr:DUF2835 domain-containing protein [Pseudoalteromonas xiamenensis]WMN59894.1 DUF2835 domain-containing protein [Pseudoalteromonas xiamenensis]